MISRLAVLSILLGVSGCASTNLTSFTDPDFIDKHYKSILVGTPGVNLEYSSLLQTKVCEAIIKNGTECTRGIDLAPPTRDYDRDQIAEIIQKSGADGYLIIAYGSNDFSRQDLGYIMQGTATSIGNTATAYGSAMPMATFSRSDTYSAALIDVLLKQKAWVSGVSTKAQGIANVTDDVFTSSLASAVADELVKSGHI